MPTFLLLLLYVFLAIFTIASLLSFLSLVGWLKIEEAYRKKLFNAFLIQVGGSLVAIVAAIASGNLGVSGGDCAAYDAHALRIGQQILQSKQEIRLLNACLETCSCGSQLNSFTSDLSSLENTLEIALPDFKALLEQPAQSESQSKSEAGE